MQSTQDITINPALVPAASASTASSPVTAASDLGDYRIIRRNGAVVAFEPSKIAVAVTKAFLAVNGGQGAASARIRELVEQLTASVVSALVRRQPSGGTFHIEDVQDQVELALMRSGEHDVARAYVLYRAKQMEERRLAKAAAGTTTINAPQIHVLENGERKLLDMNRVTGLINAACIGLEKHVDADAILAETLKNLYDGVPVEELHKSAILAARALMEKDPAYSQVTARILLHTIRKEVFGKEVAQGAAAAEYVTYFPQYIAKGIANELLDTKLAEFDLARLSKALVADRDLQFGYIGLQTLYDRYFLHVRDVRIEMPQAFYMRVAMGLALNESDREARAIEFYNLLSTFDFMSSTPTLFNSGTLRSQLSSCYLTTVSDDLEGIYDAIKENACWRNSPAAWVTTGPRCARWAPTSRAPTANRKAWCRS
jgi:ribonucleoside-diphosphate reductase alpha chain